MATDDKPQGFILLHRSILESYCFTHPLTLKLWIFLLADARWKRGYVNVTVGNGLTTVELNRGQLLFGRNKAAEKLGIPASTVYSHLQKLEQQKCITIEPFQNYSIITIPNYERYQNIDNMTTNHDGEVIPKKLRAGAGHTFKNAINRKTIEQKRIELREGIDAFAGNFNKEAMEAAYQLLSGERDNGLCLHWEKLKDFDLEKFLRQWQIEFDKKKGTVNEQQRSN